MTSKVKEDSAAVLEKFVQTALTTKLKGESRSYTALIDKLKKCDDSATLTRWLSAVAHSVSLISTSKSSEHSEFITLLFQFKWRRHPFETVRAFCNVLTNLVSANGAFLVKGIEWLVSTFSLSEYLDQSGQWCFGLPVKQKSQIAKLLEKEVEPSFQFDTSDKCREVIHATIAGICEMIPAAATCLFPVLQDNFPFCKTSAECHNGYLRNMMRVATYVPSLRDRIIRFVVSKIADMDCLVSRFEWDSHLVQERSEFDDDGKMEMDDSKMIESRDDEDGNLKKLEGMMKIALEFLHTVHSELEGREDEDGNLKKLEGMMKIALEFLHTVHSELEGREDEESREIMHGVFGSLLRAFETTILRTKGSRAVQFLVLYFCQFDHLYYETVLKRLVERILEPTESVVVRQSCSRYIASFLTGASYVRHATLAHLWKLLLAWIHEYVQLYEDQLCFMGVLGRSDYLDPSQHQVFYSVCDSVLYMFVCRFDQLQHVVELYQENDESVLTLDEKLTHMFGKLFSPSLLAGQYCKQCLVVSFLKLCSDLGWKIEESFLQSQDPEKISANFRDLVLYKMPFGYYYLASTASMFEGIFSSSIEAPRYDEEKSESH
eukprot:TRINITY_DN42095_c0_g1_i1.p1 TRINITY_DN42095_c0_g1~~TRINITY_DN42095_c0_g1_i1.p1  ORF type:complete len:619 (-),score=149.49 TRINITY_DN42095_c0_g1_i1:380-2191(-)